jgi:hypothetical protein
MGPRWRGCRGQAKRVLLQAGGLATLGGTRLQLTLKGRAALSQPAAEVIRQLWQRWLTHAVIDEFSRVEEIKGQRAQRVDRGEEPSPDGGRGNGNLPAG